MIGLHRNTTLLTTPAAVRFVSAEPLLGPIDLRAAAGTMGDRDWRSHHADVEWMIIGGKSGHGARPMHPDWARSA